MRLVERDLVGRGGEGWEQDGEAWCLCVYMVGIPRKVESYQRSPFNVCHGEVDTNRESEGAAICSLDLQDQRRETGLSFKRVTTAKKGRTRGGGREGRVKVRLAKGAEAHKDR